MENVTVKVLSILSVIVMEVKEIVTVTVCLKIIHFSKYLMNAMYAMDQVLSHHGVPATLTLGVVTENVEEKTILMNAVSVTVKVFLKDSAHATDKFLMNVESAVDQV